METPSAGFTSLLSSNSLSRWATYRPENVSRSIHVPVMDRSAFAARPLSYSEACGTFRAAARTARRAGSGRISFVGFHKFTPVPNGFVSEHVSESRPASIKDRLRHGGLRQAGCVDVSNNDLGVGSYDSRRLLMQEMPASIFNLGVNGLDAAFLSRPLGDGQRGFVLRKLTRVRDYGAVRERGECFQSKVNPDFANARGWYSLNLTHEIDVPAAPRVLGERGGFYLSVHDPRQPHPIAALEINNGVALEADRSTITNRYPPERFATSPFWHHAALSGGFVKLLTNRADGIAMNIEFDRRAASELVQVNPRRPLLAPRLGVPLDLAAVVPDVIHRTRVGRQMLAHRRVFDAVSVRQIHAENIAFKCIGAKP